MSMKRWSSFVLAALMAFVLMAGGCGGGGGGDDKPLVGSNLTISPSVLNLKVGEKSVITAADFSGEIEWAPQSIGVIKVEKTSQSTAEVFAIDGGEATILVKDSSGKTVSCSVIVTYPSVTAEPSFLSDLDFSEKIAFENESPFEVIVRVMVDPSQQISSAVLYETDINGNTIQAVRELYDNGDVNDGDDIAQDGVYSGRINVMPTTRLAGKYYFRVFLNNDFTKGSSLVYFSVVNDIPEEAYVNATEEARVIVESIVPDFNGTLTESQFQQYKTQIMTELGEATNVKNAMLIDGGNNIVVEYESGVVFYIIPSLEGDEIRSSGVIRQDNLKTYNLNFRELTLNKKNVGILAAQETTVIGSYSTRGISPFYTEFSGWTGGDTVDGAYALLHESTTPNFNVTPAIIEPTIDGFKNLSGYGIVIISSHGGVVDEVPVICTGVSSPDSKQKKDMDAKLLKPTSEGIAVTPKFITHYNAGGKSNGIVHLGLCQGLGVTGTPNNKLADAFLSVGFAAVTGYTHTVKNSYEVHCSETLIKEMIAGKTLKQAHQEATSGSYAQGPKGEKFEYRLRANVNDVVFMPTGIQNGGFEEGLIYWNGTGDVRVISSLTSQITPREGKLMNIISTGLGAMEESNSTILQQFKIPSSATQISFQYDYVSEEPMEWIGMGYNDQFQASLIDSTGQESVLVYQDIDHSTWLSLEGDIFPGGDLTGYHTGWQTVTFAIPENLKGKTVTLKFHVWDVGDSIYDSAALIDDVKILQ
ncbi:MAG: hypothetical protein LBC93_07595 [Synergistaceae bacterium]|nr:hypothetical protein [Synergistaceae bacterium]